MSRHPDRLEEGLRRMFAALDKADAELRRQLDGIPEQVEEELARERERREHRRERHRERHHGHHRRPRKTPAAKRTEDLATGTVFLIAAVLLVVMELRGSPFWFVFVALGFGISGVQLLARALSSPRPPDTIEGEKAQPAQALEPPDEDRRLDEVAAELLRELETGPAVLREVVRKPNETVEGLRRGYHALAQRERALRAAVPASGEARLSEERARLTERIARESDAVTQSRYQEALAALELQARERAAMLTAANRLEAERIRLRLTLEGLHAQVLRTRALHGTGDDGSAALRQSLERLSDEVGAVAEALETVHGSSATVQPVSPVAGPEGEGGGPDGRGRVR